MSIWTVDYEGPEDEWEKYKKFSSGFVTVEAETEEEAQEAALRIIAHSAVCSPGGRIIKVEPAGPHQVETYERRGLR